MASLSRLGAANLAIVSVYFAPVWAHDALRVLMSPYSGFEYPSHAAAAVYFRDLFELGLDGLVRTSNLLAGIKLVIAAGFLAYGIEFARSLFTGCDVNRETTNIVLALAVVGIAIRTLSELALPHSAAFHVYATELLLIAGAIVVVATERHIESVRAYQPAAGEILPASESQALGAAPHSQVANSPHLRQTARRTGGRLTSDAARGQGGPAAEDRRSASA